MTAPPTSAPRSASDGSEAGERRGHGRRDGDEADAPGGWLFWSGLAIGWAVMAYAVVGIVSASAATSPPALARWVVGSALVHDLVLAPVATIVAIVLVRAPRRWWAGPLGAALAVTAVLVGFALPLVLGLGRRDANPSALPRDYRTNLAIVVALVWATTAGVVAVRGVKRTKAR